MDWVNRFLGRGIWRQLGFFTLVNAGIFTVCMVVYSIVCKCFGLQMMGPWDIFRLFVDSNSISGYEYNSSFANALLLLTECLGTILFSGLIISIITNAIIGMVDSVKEGRVHYNLKNHIVIIGYDTIVPSIISELDSSAVFSDSKIILQASTHVDEIRNDLLSKLSKKSLKKVILIHAPRQSVEELELLYTTNAREIFVVGDRTQSDHDAENIYTFETLVNIHKKRGIDKIKPITIWFENEASYAALQLNDISAEWSKYFEFKPYNFYKRWANRLLTKSDYGKGEARIVYPELDHEGISKDSSKHVHLIVVGMNRMGVALAKEAAHMLHFPNFNEETGANRTRITFVDDNADIEMNFFIGRHPGYFEIAPVKYLDLSNGDFRDSDYFDFIYQPQDGKNFLDVQFEFVKGRVESVPVREWIKKELEDEHAITTIAICLHDPSQSFGMAMYLPEEVYTRGRDDLSRTWEVVDKDKVVNVFVRQEKTGSLIKAFRNTASESKTNKKYANLYPFGMVDDSFAIDYYSNHLAMAFNYIYDYYFTHDKKLPSDIPPIEELLKLWKTISTSNKWSNLYLADSIEFKLRSIGQTFKSIKNLSFSQEQIEKMAFTEHCRWNLEKLLMGYRRLNEKYKNDKLNLKNLKNNMFIHSLIRPYKDLTEDDKELDRNIIKELPLVARKLK